MKKCIFIAILFIISATAFAQSGLTVQKDTKGLYIPHTVSAKENFYSIGRLYNIPPKEMAAFNAIDMNNGLSVGQMIMIPLSNANFSQTATTGTPVYYVVGEKEGLYRVSVNNNKVLMADLRKWNNLSNDNISTGQRLIVGYLTAPEVASAAANAPVKKETASQPVVSQPLVSQPQPEKAAQTVKEPPVADTKPVRNTAGTVAFNDAAGGYFKTQFEQQSRSATTNKDITATSGVFKTASGWQDGKYYALIDNIEPGTIVRVVNPQNGKTVYAKVLGQMSGIRQNQGLELRISNAASSILEVSDSDKFMVRVNY